ncbi:MAG: hypothetical protein K9N48_06400 [Verrucomicrobia bacterium]|nr:hypothetical protein [Verrucomicrobiota bacterium]
MTKSTDTIKEVVNNSKHPFPQLASRSNKHQKNRYERRKIREFIKSADWSADAY